MREKGDMVGREGRGKGGGENEQVDVHKEQTAERKVPTRMKTTATMCMYILCLYISGVTVSHPHLPWLLSKIRALPLETMI